LSPVDGGGVPRRSSDARQFAGCVSPDLPRVFADAVRWPSLSIAMERTQAP